MYRSITSVLLLALLLGMHTVLAICGIRCASQLYGHQKAVSTAAGMQGMAHCHAAAQTASGRSFQEECSHSRCSHEELAMVANQQRGPNTSGTLLNPPLSLKDSLLRAMLIARAPQRPRGSPIQTSSSPESILNIRV
jgi:hypothetical protein